MRTFRFLSSLVFILASYTQAQAIENISIDIDYTLTLHDEADTSTTTKYLHNFNIKTYEPYEYSISSGFTLVKKEYDFEKKFARNIGESLNTPTFLKPDELLSFYLDTHEKYKLLAFTAIPYVHFKNKHSSLKILQFGEKTMFLYKLNFKDLY